MLIIKLVSHAYVPHITCPYSHLNVSHHPHLTVLITIGASPAGILTKPALRFSSPVFASPAPLLHLWLAVLHLHLTCTFIYPALLLNSPAHILSHLLFSSAHLYVAYLHLYILLVCSCLYVNSPVQRLQSILLNDNDND